MNRILILISILTIFILGTSLILTVMYNQSVKLKETCQDHNLTYYGDNLGNEYCSKIVNGVIIEKYQLSGEYLEKVK